MVVAYGARIAGLALNAQLFQRENAMADSPEVPDIQQPGLGPVHHVGVISPDRDQTIAQYRALPGSGGAYTVDTPVTAQLATGLTTFDMKLGFLWLGDCLLEVLEPADALSPHAAYLRECGGGIHHVAFMVPSIARARTTFTDDIALLADGNIEQNPLKWAYFESGPSNKVLIELVEQSDVADAFFGDIYDTIGRR